MSADNDEPVPQPTPELVAQLVSNHRQFLRFLEGRVGSRAIAEDILQDAFVRGMNKLSTLENDESAVAWFYRMLRNATIDHHRRKASATRALDSFAAEVGAETPTGETEQAICQCVANLADTLKPEYSEVLRKVEVEGLAVKDYAAAANITSGNAAVRVFRAREALRKQVMRCCGSCADHGCLDCTCGAKSSGGH
jgi:RNA polymerase sigma-70 factor (ECF subfamily)